MTAMPILLGVLDYSSLLHSEPQTVNEGEFNHRKKFLDYF